jgi:hypothetical protein
MGIAFEATDPAGEQIMAESGTVYRSHKEKVKELEGWDLSPFTYMKLKETARGFVFEATVTKIDCVDCTRRANKQCTAKLCKHCCLANNQSKCAAHGKTTTGTSSTTSSN